METIREPRPGAAARAGEGAFADADGGGAAQSRGGSAGAPRARAGSGGAPNGRLGRGSRSSANQSAMRVHNLGLVLDLVRSHPEGISRAEIARATGLTRSTASRLVQDLLDMRLAVEQSVLERGEPGRPATPITPAPGTFAGIGATVNLDYVSARAIDLAGNVVYEHYEPGEFRNSDPTEVLRGLGDRIHEAVLTCADSGITVTGVGIGLPGLVDGGAEDPVLQIAPNLGWRHLAPATFLGHGLREALEIALDNDANLQAVAAAYRSPGASRGFTDFLYVSGDVGVGGALVLDGEVFRGMHGWAGELGHFLVDPDGPPCPCGARGCLEMYAGKFAIHQAAGLDPHAPAGVLVRALEAGDPRALEAVAAAGHALGVTLSNAINLLDVSTVVFGTGIGGIVEWLRPAVLDVLHDRLLSRGTIHVELLAAPIDDAPASTGAAYLALDGVLETALGQVAG
ncbi:MAG TPA: ROK family protein [Actinomycetales bacterium]|nr:ROK family protein [Actinomycetales bacterium]